MNQLLPYQERYSVNRAGAAELIRADRNFTTETLIQPELERRRAVSRRTPPVLEFNVTGGRVNRLSDFLRRSDRDLAARSFRTFQGPSLLRDQRGNARRPIRPRISGHARHRRRTAGRATRISGEAGHPRRFACAGACAICVAAAVFPALAAIGHAGGWMFGG